MNTIDIQGQQVPVPEVEDNETVLDVIILARAVNVGDDGWIGERIAYSASHNIAITTVIGMVQRYMWEVEAVDREENDDSP